MPSVVGFPSPPGITAASLPYRIGVNIHVSRNGRTMTNEQLIAGVVDGGFRYVRFGTHAQDIASDNIQIVNGLTAAGVECTWVFSDYGVFDASAPSFLHPAMQTAFENFNENQFGYEAAVQNAFVLDDMRRRLGWGHVSIILPSTTGDWNDLLQYGPGVPYSDIGNLHYYAGAVATIDTTATRANLQAATIWGEGFQPKWFTENGVKHAATPPTASPNDSVMSDVVGGIALVRNALFAVSVPSVEKFAIYMLTDEPTGYGTGNGATYGLLEADGTPKASFKMFQNLFQILADRGEGDAEAMPYGCSLGDNLIYHVPIAHSDGRTFIAFWQFNSQLTTNPASNGSPWPSGTLQSIPPLPVSFTFPLGFSQATVHRVSTVGPASDISVPDAGTVVTTMALNEVQILEVHP